MIKEQDVREAIAEMQGQRDPDARTCIKLAAYYTILDHLQGQDGVPEPNGYSYSSGPDETGAILYNGKSEFAERLMRKSQEEVWPVMDELMSTLQVINPRLYGAVMRQLE